MTPATGAPEMIYMEPVTVKLTLDVPWSINHAYMVVPKAKANGRPKVIKDPRVKHYQNGVVIAAAQTPQGRFDLHAPISLKVRMVVLRVADIDIDNGLKVLVDGLARAYNFNDKHIMDIEVHKEVNVLAMPRCEVELTGMT